MVYCQFSRLTQMSNLQPRRMVFCLSKRKIIQFYSPQHWGGFLFFFSTNPWRIHTTKPAETWGLRWQISNWEQGNVSMQKKHCSPKSTLQLLQTIWYLSNNPLLSLTWIERVLRKKKFRINPPQGLVEN